MIVKSDGHGAYISGDAAYYLDKRERGFDRCIILLGADHHGYVGRMMALCAAFGDEPGVNLEIIIGQMVNLLSHGSVVRMGKRSGNIITLLDLVEAIGVDAARYALVRNSLETNLDIDLDLWTKATSDNPVFYVQYAHARVSSILRNAARPRPRRRTSHPELLTHEKEGDLLRALAEFPRVVQRRGRPCASRTGSPATSRTPPRPTTASTTAAGSCRWATRSRPTSTGPGCCWSTRPASCSPTGWRCSGSPPPSACERRIHPRGRLGARRRRAARPRAGCASRPTPTRWSPACGRTTAHKVDGVLVVGGVALPDLVADVNTPAYVLDEADFRARARAFREAFAGYDVFYAGKAFLCTTVARWVAEEGLCLDVCSDGELTVAAARRLRPGPDRLPRQHQDRARARARGRRGRRPDHRRLLRRDRAARPGDRRASGSTGPSR